MPLAVVMCIFAVSGETIDTEAGLKIEARQALIIGIDQGDFTVLKLQPGLLQVRSFCKADGKSFLQIRGLFLCNRWQVCLPVLWQLRIALFN